MAQNSQEFTSNGTWTAPSNLVNYNTVVVEVIGAAGAGGSNNKTTSADGGAGGGGGAYARNNNVVVVRGTGYAVIVGTAGAYGASNNSNGGNGTYSGFNANQVMAQPGLGGNRNGVAPTAYGARGAGGNANNSVGEVRYYGGNGAADPGTLGEGGGGGSAGWNSQNGNPGSGNAGGTGSGNSGSGGQGGAGGSNANGNVGGSYGGGGGGSGNGNASTKRGGNGSTGWVKVTWEEGLVDVKTNTVDGEIVSKVVKTHTVNAIVQGTNEKTFTVDGKIVYGVYTTSYTADAIILARTAKTITADGHFANDGIQSTWYYNFASVNTSNVGSVNNLEADDSNPATYQNASYSRAYNFGQNVFGDTVLGIQVRLDVWADVASSGNYFTVEMSWDGGTSWCTSKTVPVSGGLTTSQQTIIVGGDDDTWGHAWTISEINSASNFMLRVTCTMGSGTYCYIDYQAFRVFTSFTGTWTTYIPVSSNNDDGTEEQVNTDTPTWYPTGSNYNIMGYGYVDPNTYHDDWAVAFRSVNIPNGSAGVIIESAKVAFAAYTTHSNTVSLKIWGADTDDFGSFGQTPNLPTENTPTTAQVTWDLTSGDAWTDKVYYYTPELASIIQEIIDRPGWTAGNDIAIIVEDDGSSDSRAVYDYTYGSMPVLLLEWSIVKTHTADAIISEEGGATTYTKTNTVDGVIAQQLTYQVSASGDDNMEEDDGTANPIGVGITFSIIGWSSGYVENMNNGFRFQSILIPRGSTIIDATLTLREHDSFASSISSPLHYHFYGQAADNAPAFVAVDNDILNRTTTTNYASYEPSTAPSDDTDFLITGLATAIQEIIDRTGWYSGNSLVVLGLTQVSDSNNGVIWYETYDKDAANAPELTITYITSGLSTGTKTHTADGIISGTNVKTFTADGLITTKAVTLTDNFNDNSRDTSKWNEYTALGGSVSETSQHIECTPANSTDNSYAGYQSTIYYDLTDSEVEVYAVQVADITNCYTDLEVRLDGSNYYGIGIGSGLFEAYRNVGGSFSTPYTTAYDSGVHKYWRIRESGGWIYFDYSTDGVTWVNFHREADGFSLAYVSVSIFAYEHTPDATPGTAIFDDFNIYSAGTDITTLTDNFDDNSIDTAKWTEYEAAGGTVTESSGALQFSLADSTVGSWSGVYSKVQYNLTGKRVFVKFIDASGGKTWFDLTLSLEQLPIVDNFFSVAVNTDTGVIEAVEEIGGDDNVLYSEAYNPTTHKYLGIYESGGTTYFQYSTDGVNWNTYYSCANIFPVTNLYVVLDAYEHTSSTGNVFTFDEFNLVVSTKTNTADGIIASREAKTHTTDAIVSQTNVKTNTADGIIVYNTGFRSKVGSLDSPTSTGEETYEVLDFTPKALILIFERLSSDGNYAGSFRTYGFGVSSSSRASVGSRSRDNIAGSTVSEARSISNADILYAVNDDGATASVYMEADLVSLNGNGFTLNWQTVQTTSYVVNYIAVGGDDLTNVAIDEVQVPGSTGQQSVSDLGFQPDALLTIFSPSTSATPAVVHNAGGQNGMGFAASNGAYTAVEHNIDSSGTKQSAGAQRSDIALAISSTADTVRFEATLVSLDSGGWTWNWTTINANNYVFVLALKGGRFKVGKFNQNTTTEGTGIQTISGAGFEAKLALMQSFNKAATTSLVQNGYNTFGAATSSSERFGVWLGVRDNVSTSVVDSNLDRTNVLKMMTEGTPSNDATADFDAFNSDGFSIDNTALDSTSREVIYLLMGDEGTIVEVKTHTADGIISEAAATYTKTHTADGIIRETLIQSHTVDALVRAAGFKTITADGIVKVSNSKTDTTDAVIQSSGYIGRSVDWYNSSWSYRVRITVKASKVDVDLTNYPVYVNLAHLPAAFHTHVNQTDARDIRVTKADGVTELAREVVWYTAASDTGELHFKADFISSDIDTVFYVYYGNSGASDYGVTDTYGRNNVWTAYSGVWHLHESGNGTAGEYKDSTGTNNGQGGAGDAGKTPTATAFKIGNGQDFAPANTDYITLGTPTTWNNLTQFTIESWVNLDTATANSDIVRNLRDTGGGIGLQSVDTGSRFQAMLASTSAAQYKKTTSASYTTGVDYHVVATWKYADEPSGMHIYVNGVDKALTTSWDGGPTNTGNNPNTMLFAAQPNPSTPNFDGKIDEIRISSTAFSSTWVSTTYNNQSSPSTFYDVSSEQGSFTADGIIKVSLVKTNTIDGIISVTSIKTNTVDGIIKETFVQTNTADGLITAGGEKTFSVDGIILVTSIKTFTADGIITEKKVVSITADGVVKTIETKTITVDGIILVVGVKSNTADGIISLTSVKTNTVDGIVLETFVQSNTADGLINAGGFKLLTIDGIISETKYATYTIDGGIIPEWARYSRGNYQYLPTDDSTLENPFTPAEYALVESHNYEYVNQAATGQAAVFLFKWQNINDTQTITFDWTGKTDRAPSASPVYLQVYRQSTGDWLTLDDDSATGAETEFSLQGQVLDDVENYYDASNWVAFRVYQVAF